MTTPHLPPEPVADAPDDGVPGAFQTVPGLNLITVEGADAGVCAPGEVCD
ncbi:hypothetical protein [Microlunatus parietis]|uniref:Uncharacterized protein n=1 Tax=Microlunatus parietis TaxID=682979 RepID=A0A7Y9I2F8_9ACTN|nr:hypothetical protein [Microlunatus parietis]NYE69022.1 hypothetical protein [Microlunatus parietis]